MTQRPTTLRDALIAARPHVDAVQGALELYLKEVQPVDGRAKINISLNELNVLRRLAATPAVGGEAILARCDELHDLGFSGGWDAAKEACADYLSSTTESKRFADELRKAPSLRTLPAAPLRDQANYKIGKWLSAALEDPNVCAEMKADISEWFESQIVCTCGGDLKQLPAWHDISCPSALSPPVPPGHELCSSCGRLFKFGDTCPRGGCHCGGDV